MARTKTPPAVAYSYLRFSSPEQAKGDSLRRQTELRDAWLARSGATLDTSLTLADKGVSGFTGKHRENPDRHALAAFLRQVEQGRVARGSYLIVENLDRLSREHIQPALILFLNLLQAGVRVVQLVPAEQVFDDKSESMQIMMAIMELSRGNSESQMKSVRLGAAWRDKRKRAAEKSEPLTRAVPCWLKVVGVRKVGERLDFSGANYSVKEDAAEVVRRIYRMATTGHGLGVITKRLNAEGVPPIGRAEHWARSSVAKLLGTRAVIGEYQPHKGHAGPGRKPDGPPIPDYFPAILTEQEWYAARAALTGRRSKPGRIGKRVNLFTGLLRDARDGGTLQSLDKGSGPSLASYRARQGVKGAKYVSFPLATFEAAVLEKLREIDPREVLPDRDCGADRVSALIGELDAVRGRIEKLKAALDGDDDIKAVVDKLRKWETEEAALADELTQARQETASPLSRAWDECRTLTDALAKAPDPDEARTRLRAALRRIVSAFWCLFVAKGQDRVAAVQVWFEGGTHRDYLIYHKAARGSQSYKRPAEWRVESFFTPGRRGDLDLRDRKHAAALEKALAEMDVPADESPKPTRRRGKK